jgi:hypothetical protein
MKIPEQDLVPQTILTWMKPLPVFLFVEQKLEASVRMACW